MDTAQHLDFLLSNPRVCVFGGLAVCQDCGSTLAPVAAVGLAVATLGEHRSRPCRPDDLSPVERRAVGG